MMRLIATLAVTAALVGVAGQPTVEATQQPSVKEVVEVACDKPSPTTPQGYQDLWSTIPVEVWGAADVSLSVRMAGRRVWLYGDTMSARENGFVHSTAIVQRRGCLTVSDGGAQLLPDDDANHIYWIHSAKRVPETMLIRVEARSIELTGQGVWSFRDNGFFRYALVRLHDDDQVRFVRWDGKDYTPPPDPGLLIDFDEPGGSGHFGYSIKRHNLLPDGRRLMTVCQNWDDGVWHGWDAYRPIFYAQGEEWW